MSFFSGAFYRHACLNWKGTGFAYLLLLLAICWIPPMIQLQLGLSNFVVNEAPKMVSQVPEIIIVDGEAFIEENQPYYIKDPETGKILVVIDTTGEITSLAETDAVVLVTDTQATFKKSEFENRSFSFSEIKELTLNQEMITGWLNVMRRFAVPVLYPLTVAVSFAFRIVQLLIYAVIGMLFASLCKSERTYESLIRLSVVAVTPCIIINTILGVMGVAIPLAGLWYFLITMGYLFFGVKAAAREEGQDGGSGVGEAADPPKDVG